MMAGPWPNPAQLGSLCGLLSWILGEIVSGKEGATAGEVGEKAEIASGSSIGFAMWSKKSLGRVSAARDVFQSSLASHFNRNCGD
jgi:hypothetical protein